MKKNNDSYDLVQKSKFGLLGYECFQNKDTKMFYFHFNDKNGKALLYSQGYSSMNGRDNGIKSTSLNRKDSDRYELMEEEEQHYFILKAKNGQEIGRSRFFKKKEKMLAQIKYLQEFNYDVSILEEKENGRKIQDIYQKEIPFSKNAFRLNIYSDSNSDLKGKIEHLTSENKLTFEKLDGNQLVEFISKNIKENVPKIRPEEQPVQEVNHPPIFQFVKASKMAAHITDPDPEILDKVEVWKTEVKELERSNRKMISSITHHKELNDRPLEIQLALKDEQNKFYNLTLDVMNSNGGKVLYYRQFQNTIPTDGNLKLDLATPNIEHGLYKLSATIILAPSVELLNKNANAIKESKLFQV